MTVTVTATKSANVTVDVFTPINGATVTLATQNLTPLVLHPADAFAIGDALKDAARKAGFTPTP